MLYRGKNNLTGKRHAHFYFLGLSNLLGSGKVMTIKAAERVIAYKTAVTALHIANAIPGVHIARVAKQGRGLERDGVALPLLWG